MTVIQADNCIRRVVQVTGLTGGVGRFARAVSFGVLASLLASAVLPAADAPPTAASSHPIPATGYWAYQSLASPTPPKVKNEAWVRTPIDRFILADLESAGLKPAPEVEPEALCRRLYFDLIGLPPSPQQLDEFIAQYTAASPAQADGKPVGEQAYAALVDRLLASPQYGERWGRHWLDLARYADSSGYHEDIDRPFAWRYRDYVIRSFNDDKPYPRFIEEQLAGDELAPQDAQAWIATGFCRNGPTNDQNMGQGIAKERYRLDLLDDVVSTTSTVFLGQTVGCARCHDHKIDPIPQRDYYRMLAIFDNTARVDMGQTATGDIVPVKSPKKQKGKPSTQPAVTAAIMALTDAGGPPRTTFILRRGDVTKPAEAVEPGIPEVMAYAPLAVPAPSPGAKTTGRRLALARWIAAPQNPLTWRVVVNRIWQHHFGTGIVATPSNFGKSGAAPTHPQLLDWLAGQMIANGGHWKPLHRMIVMSAAWRQSTHGDAGSYSIDPQNKLLSRMNVRRLEAEAIRDSILAVAGTLNLQPGGPGIKPRISRELLVASQRNKWPAVDHEGPALWRRSVYIYVKRQLPFPMLELFDAPETTHTCDRRNENVIPTQALVLMNAEFTQEQAQKFAARVLAQAGSDRRAQISAAMRLALSRAASDTEISEAIAFVDQQTAAHRPDSSDDAAAFRAALVDFCHVLLNCNEFVYLN